jgi:hypothetical protein
MHPTNYVVGRLKPQQYRLSVATELALNAHWCLRGLLSALVFDGIREGDRAC